MSVACGDLSAECAFLFLLAFDAWVQFVPHGGRYGAGGFNVGHFASLDAVQPLPSPALHVGHRDK